MRPKTANGLSKKVRKEVRKEANAAAKLGLALAVRPYQGGARKYSNKRIQNGSMNRRRKKGSRSGDLGVLVDDEYALAVAFPESNVEGRIPDNILRASTAQTLRQRYVWTMSAGGRGVLAINPQLKSHTNEGTVNDATGAITWGGLADHVDYTSMAANFARYRVVALGARVVNSASTYLELSGELGSVQLSGLDSTTYPSAAGAFTTILSYNCENVAPVSVIPEEGGFRAVWIPAAEITYGYQPIDLNTTAYGCGNFGALLLTAIGLPASTTLVVETFMKVETLPYADTEYLYTPKMAIANEGAIEGALLKCARWLASSGKTVAGATEAMKSLSVMTALERAGGFLGRIIGIGGTASSLSFEERVLAELVKTGRLEQKLSKLASLQTLPPTTVLTARAMSFEEEKKSPETPVMVSRPRESIPSSMTAVPWFRP